LDGDQYKSKTFPTFTIAFVVATIADIGRFIGY
jgi:hypothetical protein